MFSLIVKKQKRVKLLASWHKSRQCHQTVVVILHCHAFAVYTWGGGSSFTSCRENSKIISESWVHNYYEWWNGKFAYSTYATCQSIMVSIKSTCANELQVELGTAFLKHHFYLSDSNFGCQSWLFGRHFFRYKGSEPFKENNW